MGRIKRFSQELANQIAAGEVVERPASALKELIENAVDAGASHIDILLEDGGKSLISVADDGCGIAAQDLELALEPHASSKITSIDDLQAISTLGFRGEALSAISSVSDFTITSKEASESSGWELSCYFGRKSGLRPVGRQPGTTVSVKDLFMELPGRRAFLKSKRTEQGRCLKVVRLAATAWPEIRFSLKSGNRVLFSSSAGRTGADRVSPLLGDAFIAHLVALQGGSESSPVHLHGFIAHPDRVRLSTRQVYFFINRRPATAPVLFRALNDAMKGRLVKGQHPAAVLFLKIDPDLVDVNVHPAKLEVRFRRPEQIYRIIYHAVRNGLDSVGDPMASMDSSDAGKNGSAAGHHYADGPGIQHGAIPFSQPKTDFSGLDSVQNPENEISAISSSIREHAPAYETGQSGPGVDDHFPFPIPDQGTPKSGDVRERTAISANMEAIGQLANSYILAQTGNGLLILDQHAAHEAILFKRLQKEYQGSGISSQRLAFPLVLDLDEMEQDGASIPGVSLTPEDIESLLSAMASAGIDAEPFGEGQIVIRSLPAILSGKEKEDSEWLREMIIQVAASGSVDSPGPQEHSWKSGNNRPGERVVHEVLARLACSGAIKAGTPLNIKQQQALLDECVQEQVTHCPHGRPIWLFRTISEIEKDFRRK